MSEINTALELFSAATGLGGALLLALKSRFAPWAWAAWMLSNIGWIIFGLHGHLWGLVAQNAGFLVTSGIGCWTWIVKPYLAGSPSPVSPPQHVAENSYNGQLRRG